MGAVGGGYRMNPTLVIFQSTLGTNGPGYPPEGGAPPPPDTPLKVWDGTQWQPAGIKVEE